MSGQVWSMWLVALATACGGGAGELVVTTVSEYGGTPIPGVRVQVDDEAWQTTDADGTARFAGGEPPFVVRVAQTMTDDTFRFDDVWQLTHDTGDPLAIAVDGSLVPFHQGSISGAVTGRTGDPGSQVVVHALLGPRGAASGPAEPDGTFELAVQWEGPSAQPAVVHALESDTADPPTHYTGHAIASATLDDAGGGAEVSDVALALAPVDEVHVTGTLTMPAGLAGDLLPLVAVELPDGSALTLTRAATTAPGAFDFTLPVLEGGSPRIGFYALTLGSAPPYPAVSFVERRLDATTTAVDLELPAPVELLEPAAGATIGPSTVFRWGAVSGGAAYGLSVTCEWDDGGTSRNVNYRIVETTATEATLPDIPDISLPAGEPCLWSVGWFADADFGYQPTRPASRAYSYSAERMAIVE